MDVSAIFLACQQGDWVRRTIPQAHESLRGLDYEILVVDDQSTDGCCHGLGRDVTILRSPERLGVTGGRAFATKRARGEVLLFSDPHCDYSGSALRDLVEMAIDTRCICQPKSKSKPKERRERFGGVLKPCDRGLRIKYQYDEPAKYPALLGTVYAVRKEVDKFIGGWPQLPGVWGYAEQALTLQSWFMAVPIRVDTRHTIIHYNYQINKRFPYSVSLGDQGANAHWMHALYFPETYATHWQQFLDSRFGTNRAAYTSQLWGKEFMRQKAYLEDRRQRSEFEFYHEYLKMPFPKAAPKDIEATDSNEPEDSVRERISNAIAWMDRSIHGCIKGKTVIDIGTPQPAIALQCLKSWEAGECRAYGNSPDFPTKAGPIIWASPDSIPEQNEYADVISSFHADNISPSEMVRILKPGGRILLTAKLGDQTEYTHRLRWETLRGIVDVKTKVKTCHGGKEIRLLATKYKG